MPSIASLVLVLTSFIEFFTYSKSLKVWVFFNSAIALVLSSTFLTRPSVSPVPSSPKTIFFKVVISWLCSSLDETNPSTSVVKVFTRPANWTSASSNLDNMPFSSSNLSPCSSVNADIWFNSSTILFTVLASTLLSNSSDNCFNWYAKVGASSEPSLNTNEAKSLSLLLISLIFVSCSALVALVCACTSDLIASFRTLAALVKESASAAIDAPETADPTIRAMIDCFNTLFFIRNPYYGFRFINVRYVQYNIFNYLNNTSELHLPNFIIIWAPDQQDKMKVEI